MSHLGSVHVYASKGAPQEFKKHFFLFSFQLLDKTSVQVIPGRDTELKIAAEVRKRLLPPWGDCVDELYLQSAQFGSGKRVRYTLDACMDECYEIELHNVCSCKDVNSMGLMASVYESVNACGDIKMGYRWMVKNMTCMNNVRRNFVDVCRVKCANACQQITFSVISSAAQWPEPMESIPFYKTYIKNMAIQQSFFEEFQYDKENKRFNESSHSDLENLFYFIRQRFTKVKIYFPSETYREYADHTKTSSAQLLSQVGAILNFWTGITVLLFVELADCFLKISNQLTQRNSTNDTVDESDAPKQANSK